MWFICRRDKIVPLEEQSLEFIAPDKNNPYGYRIHISNRKLVCKEPHSSDGRPENYINISRRIRKKN